ncbi:MAG: HD domain-containing protein [Candidatus Dojkabacteria bacterium]|nr:HD domain-containing protein [Candidatus Dojkabacteria bacterium]
MKNIFRAIQILNNLNHIKRTGPNLFSGIPNESLESIAEHSYKVAYLCLIFSKKLRNVNLEKLLIYSLIDDWGECVLGDIPSQSPSYRSYFKGDSRKYFKEAERKARNLIYSDAGIEVPEFNDEEFRLFKFCDSLAIVLELIDLRQQGYKHKWIEKMFKVQIKSLQNFQYEFADKIVVELKKLFLGGMDNYYLTKDSKS